jgi:hypothetical protein
MILTKNTSSKPCHGEMAIKISIGRLTLKWDFSSIFLGVVTAN